MKPTILPMICATALVTMLAAGVSHWWSVNSFVAMVDAGLPIPAAARPAAQPALAAHTPVAASTAPDEATQKKFYETLISKMEALQNQNRNLLDQVAETNRDVMKLEFRVDTHSESFRPLPVNEERLDTSSSFDDAPGVLPPRAEPVFLPTGE